MTAAATGALVLPATATAAAAPGHATGVILPTPNPTAEAAGAAYSFDVPSGDYDLMLKFGNADTAASTGVQVEARRTVLAPVETNAGEFVTRTVTVNVRTPESMPTGEEGQGIPGLQVYTTGSGSALIEARILPPRPQQRIVVISDSTAADWATGPKCGWAQAIPQYFREGLSVANFADSGESSVSWLANPTLWATVKPQIREGDEVFIQLAHNDKQTTEADFRTNITALIDGARQQYGQPVVVTPPCRILFDATGKITPTGRIVNDLNVDLPAVLRDLAHELHTPLLDLTTASETFLEQLGPDEAPALYVDHTHTNASGAPKIAELIVNEIHDARLDASWFIRPRIA
jgi:lysophospholipase L1-like esterase